MNKFKGPLALMILDGWGIGRADDAYNAIARGRTPHMTLLSEIYPHTALACSGEAVGLPEGQMGNSEVGHLNIGAGRVVYQDFTRITKAIREGEFFHNPVLDRTVAQVKQGGGALHLMGLVSDGGVHSHISHVYALLALAKQHGLKRVYIHAFLDGRDVPPKSALEYLAQLEQKTAELGVGKIADVAGRYYAMDRDKRWDRVAKAYGMLIHQGGLTAGSAAAAVAAAYDRGETDEFVQPTVVCTDPDAAVKPGDGVIFFNFRPDRAREITRAFVDKDFDGFERPNGYFPVHFTMMTQYDETLQAPCAFAPQQLTNTLGEVISKAGLTQLRIAETEKYAHVTYFFSGGEEQLFPGEDRLLIPSPKVATYDLKPEMSAFEVTERLVTAIKSGKYDFIILNFANGDMVGHTGKLDAAIAAVQVVDTCVGKVVDAVRDSGGIACITADHGNAEIMKDPETGEPFTAHTSNKVPFIVVSERHRGMPMREGSLADIAPTLLELAGLAKPEEMTGRSLFEGGI